MTINSKSQDDAVSPVIGVILMVAITVILAAVIAAFVFGMAGNIQSSKTVGITFNLNSANQGVATISGGTDLASLNSVNYTLNNGNETQLFVAGTGNISVGKIATTSATIAKGSRVIIIGYFSDGTNQILVDKQF
jgi:flagellin-like protein